MVIVGQSFHNFYWHVKAKLYSQTSLSWKQEDQEKNCWNIQEFKISRLEYIKTVVGSSNSLQTLVFQIFMHAILKFDCVYEFVWILCFLSDMIMKLAYLFSAPWACSPCWLTHSHQGFCVGSCSNSKTYRKGYLFSQIIH